MAQASLGLDSPARFDRLVDSMAQSTVLFQVSKGCSSKLNSSRTPNGLAPRVIPRKLSAVIAPLEGLYMAPKIASARSGDSRPRADIFFFCSAISRPLAS